MNTTGFERGVWMQWRDVMGRGIYPPKTRVDNFCQSWRVTGKKKIGSDANVTHKNHNGQPRIGGGRIKFKSFLQLFKPDRGGSLAQVLTPLPSELSTRKTFGLLHSQGHESAATDCGASGQWRRGFASGGGRTHASRKPWWVQALIVEDIIVFDKISDCVKMYILCENDIFVIHASNRAHLSG